MNKKWHSVGIDEVYKTLECDEHGLKSSDVEKHALKYGKNILPKEKKDGFFKIFFSQFASPIVLIMGKSTYKYRRQGRRHGAQRHHQ